MINERVSNLDFVDKNLGHENYTIAPLPVDKQYESVHVDLNKYSVCDSCGISTSSSNCFAVKSNGIASTHSHLSSLTIRKYSPLK